MCSQCFNDFAWLRKQYESLWFQALLNLLHCNDNYICILGSTCAKIHKSVICLMSNDVCKEQRNSNMNLTQLCYKVKLVYCKKVYCKLQSAGKWNKNWPPFSAALIQCIARRSGSLRICLQAKHKIPLYRISAFNHLCN